jgi:glycosyltransferase involved in cell wall biosynthesis
MIRGVNMSEKLISVIVPIYNVEKYLDECINSIVNQKYQNLEIILVNDGSTDGCMEICRRYALDKRIIIIDKKNEGLSKARQTGIDLCKGEYFCSIDPDDYISEYYISSMTNKIDEDKADICVCERIDFNEKYKRDIPIYEYKLNPKKINRVDIISEYKFLCDLYVMSDSWNKLYRTDFVRNSGIRFNLNNKYNGTDYLFNHLLILHQPKISIVYEKLYFHRLVEGSRVRRKNKPLQEGFGIIMSQICAEVKVLNYSHEIDVQLSLVYLGLQKQVISAINDDNKSIMQKKLKLQEYLNEHKNQISRFERICLYDINRKNVSIMERLLLQEDLYYLLLYFLFFNIIRSFYRMIKPLIVLKRIK